MTRFEFSIQYAKASGWEESKQSVHEWLREFYQVPILCYCGEGSCNGWQTVTDRERMLRDEKRGL